MRRVELSVVKHGTEPVLVRQADVVISRDDGSPSSFQLEVSTLLYTAWVHRKGLKTADARLVVPPPHVHVAPAHPGESEVSRWEDEGGAIAGTFE